MQVDKLNWFKRFFEAATAEVAFEDFKAQSPDEFKAWKTKVVQNGPPKDLDDGARVRWGVYLEKLGLADTYKLDRGRDTHVYS